MATSNHQMAAYTAFETRFVKLSHMRDYRHHCHHRHHVMVDKTLHHVQSDRSCAVPIARIDDADYSDDSDDESSLRQWQHSGCSYDEFRQSLPTYAAGNAWCNNFYRVPLPPVAHSCPREAVQ